MKKKRDSKATRQRILDVAEELFAEQGFDGSRMDEIAKRADVNKALIYYYFKSKDDVLDALFVGAIEEMFGLFGETHEDLELDEGEMEQMFAMMFEMINSKKRIIKIMMMESLKDSESKPPIFKIAEYFISGEIEAVLKVLEDKGLKSPQPADRRQMMVTEFFTGMMPFISLVVLQDAWCREFGMDMDELKAKFLNAMKATHFAYHQHLME